MAGYKQIEPRWKPGESGNPDGRPKGIPNAKTRYLRLLELVSDKINPVTGKTEKFTQIELMDIAVFNKALKGDLPSYKEIMDRLEGKAPQAMDITTGGEPIQFINDLPRPTKE